MSAALESSEYPPVILQTVCGCMRELPGDMYNNVALKIIIPYSIEPNGYIHHREFRYKETLGIKRVFFEELTGE